jgi:glycosyltransferase involved in cell wall biosynthesis
MPDLVVVVVPAHDEADRLAGCLVALGRAASAVPAPVVTVAVLDACSDESLGIAARFEPDVHCLEVDERCVGAARAAGFAHARRWYEERGYTAEQVWFATTDADSRVDADWLTRQVAASADVVLGVVRVANWRNVPRAAVRRYLAAYRAKYRPDGHGHIHGANMGFAAQSYWQVGGFDALRTGEDVDLVRRFEAHGMRISRDSDLSVATSARRTGRAPTGFAAHLRSIGKRPEKV